ncbi:MAG TPA: DUF86 domain-containing protein [Acidimicrobiales bacterium]|nr:DUF86 domain-containing protein [Acidimicrobiales bacterium]
MTPRSFDRQVAARRLRLLRDTLDELAAVGDVTAERLHTESVTRAATERLIQVAVDLAIDVNSHVAVAQLGRSPDSGYESFGLAAAAGATTADLARRLAPAAGLRNRLVHRYDDIRVDLVAAAVDELLTGFDVYIKQVAAFIAESRNEGDETEMSAEAADSERGPRDDSPPP